MIASFSLPVPPIWAYRNSKWHYSAGHSLAQPLKTLLICHASLPTCTVLSAENRVFLSYEQFVHYRGREWKGCLGVDSLGRQTVRGSSPKAFSTV